MEADLSLGRIVNYDLLDENLRHDDGYVIGNRSKTQTRRFAVFLQREIIQRVMRRSDCPSGAVELEL